MNQHNNEIREISYLLRTTNRTYSNEYLDEMLSRVCENGNNHRQNIAHLYSEKNKNLSCLKLII